MAFWSKFVKEKLSVEEAISMLESDANERQRARLIKGGIQERYVLGVNKPAILRLAKKVGHDQNLANALWLTEFHEARLCAILIADPELIDHLTLLSWINDLWSWGITDHLARYLFPAVWSEALLSYCLGSQALYVKRLGFAAIACRVQLDAELSDEFIEPLYEFIRAGAQDERHHVRKAVVWALVEIGKSSESRRQAAYLVAAGLTEDTVEAIDKSAKNNAAEKWVGRRAIKALEQLISVPDRRRLISAKSKTGQRELKQNLLIAGANDD